jgi:hypothetical protein
VSGTCAFVEVGLESRGPVWKGGLMVEEPLVGGYVSAVVVRVGDTVRRETGPWTPGVQELLRYLQEAGFPYSPKLLGTDGQGREVLAYIEGDTVCGRRPMPAWAWSDDTLIQTARVLREYHEVVRDFRPKSTIWRYGPGELEPGQVLCHNDVGPHNLVYREGRVVGLIDWDGTVYGYPQSAAGR